eukprot:TRINITY_DN11322_c0_g1_i1.p2 TRINITY_DN11322_c0_g1~~TRINITY_DN11322_c0_g1_i1.p2  ORF type:complete len:412 (+),score=151.23 TRINITY_DN11322_c0_g1_i1:135-1370(+)
MQSVFRCAKGVHVRVVVGTRRQWARGYCTGKQEGPKAGTEAAGGQGGAAKADTDGGVTDTVGETSVRMQQSPEEIKAKLQQLRDVQRTFDLQSPMELQMMTGSKIETADDLPPRYRFTPPASVKKRMFDEQVARLEKIPDVKIVRDARGQVKIIDVPMDAITKAEIDYNIRVHRRVYMVTNLAYFALVSMGLAFLFCMWKVLSADPGPPPDEPIGKRVYLDIYQEDERIGTVVLGLYTDRCPMTCENFHRLITGDTADGVSYRNSEFFSIFPNVGIIGGDYVRNTGSGGRPVLPYFPGKRFFPDEIAGKDLPFFKGALCSVGSMFARKPNANDSTFLISTAGTMKHNHSFVIFGEVLYGMDVLEAALKVRLRGHRPVRRVWIKSCGEYNHTPEEREFITTLGPAATRSDRY